MHEVAPGAQPERLHRAVRHVRRALRGHEAAERAQAREARLDARGDRLADQGMDAVGADERVGAHRRFRAGPAGEANGHAAGVLREPDQPAVEVHGVVGQAAAQELEEVRAMGDVAMRAVEPFAGLAHGLHGEDATVLPAPELPRGIQAHGEVREAVGETQLAERPHHVRRDDDARAGFLQFVGLLVDLGVQAGPAQEQGGGKAAQAPAGDRDLHLRRLTARRGRGAPSRRTCRARWRAAAGNGRLPPRVRASLP